MTKPLPSLGRLIDGAYRLREKRMEAQKVVSELKRQEEEIKVAIEQSLSDQSMTSGKGQLATASIKSALVPTVEDWDKVRTYILRHKDLHMLEKRIAVARWREVIEDKPRGVPGITPFEKTTLSLTKL